MTMMRSDKWERGSKRREKEPTPFVFSVLIVSFFFFKCLNFLLFAYTTGHISPLFFFVVVHRYHGYVWRASWRNMIWNKKHREWRFGGQESVFFFLFTIESVMYKSFTCMQHTASLRA